MFDFKISLEGTTFGVFRIKVFIKIDLLKFTKAVIFRKKKYNSTLQQKLGAITNLQD